MSVRTPSWDCTMLRYRFVTLPATSADEPATADFGPGPDRGGASDDVR